MTIRNFLPGFGMRYGALAVLAVVALAALLAVGSPASAQSLTGTEIWSATMTTGIQAPGTNKLSIGDTGNTDPVNIGSLTGGDLDTGRRGYPVHILSESIFTDITLSTAGRRLWFGPGIRSVALCS